MRLCCGVEVLPKGPQGQKRPADAVALAVMVGRIATGEIEEDGYADYPRGSAGGKARASALSPEDRNRAAKAAAEARWKERRVG